MTVPKARSQRGSWVDLPDPVGAASTTGPRAMASSTVVWRVSMGSMGAPRRAGNQLVPVRTLGGVRVVFCAQHRFPVSTLRQWLRPRR